MHPKTETVAIQRFGAFELDLRSGELRKKGVRIRLQEQPFEVLTVLLQRPGEVVTREELRSAIWPADTFVDFDNSLNTAINKLREALGDSADSPRFIETLPRRGYRFIAPVNGVKPVSASKQLATGKIMLAVLPFDNLSGDREQEYFSDGLTEEMINQLGRLHPERLGVIARTSAMKYKHANKGIDQIGSELGVDYVLEGGVRRAGEHLRITAQLIQVTDQTHLWAESYERDLRDALALQSEVALAIASEINVKLTPQQRTRLANTRPLIPAAYEAYLKGRFYWNKRTADGVKKGIEHFEKAIEKDPSCPLAYVGLADSYGTLGFYAYAAPRDAYPKAKATALRALEIDDELTEAQASLADVKLYYDWDWSGAEKEFNRVVERNPAYATGRLIYGDLLIAMGRFKEGIAETEKAQELDPLSLIINAGVGWCFYFARQYDRAIEQFRKTLEMDQHFVPAHAWLGETYLQQGLFPEGITELRAASEISGGSHLYIALLAHAYGVAGDKAQAQKILDQLKDQSARSYVSSYSIGEVCLALGDRNQAFDWLEKAYEERARALVMLKVEPKVDPLRSDPRFQDLLRRMNFPP